jgi:HAE1 family hydrophobic/amphiphilic exporter-1
MNISKIFIKRPVMTTLIMLPLLVFGFLSYKYLPVSALPIIESPTIEVITSYPGANAEKMSRLVSGPLERQFLSMQGIQFVSSSNTYETSTIVLQFHDGVNIDVAAQEVQNAINLSQGVLPQELPNPPAYYKTNPADTPILFAALYSDRLSQSKLYEYAYNYISQQIGTINGVGYISIWGFPFSIRIKLDPEALAAKNITLDELSAILNRENPDQPIGKFYGPNFSMTTAADGQLYTAEKYKNVIVKYENDAPVRVKDIGVVEESTQNDKEFRSWTSNGQKTESFVGMGIYKQQGFNTLAVCEDIENLLARIKKELPESVGFDITFSQSKFILDSINEVELTLIIAFLLVVFVVYFYLGKLRTSLIPLISLPITVTATFFLMYIRGFSADIMSMSALTLGIGFLVDDAIVVLENIVRFGQMGYKPYEAALRGSKQIVMTVIAISLCLALVFVPLLFIPGQVGSLFYEFAAVILIAVLFSGFISLSLTPMLSSKFLKEIDQNKLTKVEIISNKLNNFLIKHYKKYLIYALERKKAVLAFSLLSLVASIVFFLILPKTFLPGDDLSIIQGIIQTKTGTSPYKMKEIADKVERVLHGSKYVDSIMVHTGLPTDNQALCFIFLKDPKERPGIQKVIQELREQVISEVVGVKMFMKAYPLVNLQIGGMSSNKASYQYVLRSLDEKVLFDSFPAFFDAISNRKELSQVSSDLIPFARGVDLNIQRDQARSYQNLDATNIENTLMYAYGETYISKMNTPENIYYLILQASDPYVKDPNNLKNLYFGKDQSVAIDSVIESHWKLDPVQLNHINGFNSITISFDVGSGYALSEALKALDEEAKNFLPSQVIATAAGSTAAFKTIFKQLGLMIFLAIFVIYVILGIIYENFLYPITPLSVLPLTLVGGLLSLVIVGEVLSVYAMIGFIMLIGIVMKNGILIVDFALEEMNIHKKSPYDAIISASIVRFRPIIMTTFAAMMGSIPIALGFGGTISKGRAPLGIVVVGGLVFSQLVTLFVIPVFFLYVSKVENFFLNKFSIFNHDHPIDTSSID